MEGLRDGILGAWLASRVRHLAKSLARIACLALFLHIKKNNTKIMSFLFIHFYIF